MMDAGIPSPKETRKRRYCAKCQKHNLMKELKGHKNRCKYRWCHCQSCYNIELKRNTTRINVKRRRDEMLEKELAARRARESPEMDRKVFVENLSQIDPPIIPKDVEIPSEVADLRIMPPAHKELLDMDRGTSVETLTHPEPPTLPADKDILIDVKDLRPPHKKDLIHINRRTSEESLHQLEPPVHPKENEISSEISEIRTQKAVNTVLPLGGETVQPDLATIRIQDLRDEYKELDGHKNFLFKKALLIEETRQWLNEATKEVQQQTGSMWDGVTPPFYQHYHSGWYQQLGDTRGKDHGEGGLYPLPAVPYPLSTDPLAYHFHFFRTFPPYSYAHPSTSYAFPPPEMFPPYVPRDCADVPSLWDSTLKFGNLKPRMFKDWASHNY